MTETQLDRIEAKLDEVLALLNKPKRVVKARKEAAYPPAFEDVWALYPKRAGANPKQAAYSAFKARQTNKRLDMDMYQGVQRYAAFCKATGKLGTEYVMQAATFFGPRREWENDWAIPDMATAPTTEEGWYALAVKRNVATRPGEGWPEFKQRIMDAGGRA